jgi:phosphinothricin acetyltransferase
MLTELVVRPATEEDLAAIAKIYNQGIRDRIASFETRERSPEDIRVWLERHRHPLLLAQQDGEVLGWVAASDYRPRDCYAGIAEFSIYIAKSARGQGVGSALLSEFLEACENAGFWKVLSRIFPENKASLALCKKHGFREVGSCKKHAKLDGTWRDVVIVERLLERNL